MKKKAIMRTQWGFTFLELLFAISVGAIVMGGIYAAYSTQQKAFQSSDQIAEMQQNLRAAMVIMGKEIREAGCDPNTVKANAGFVSASIGSMRFTRDIAGNSLRPDESDGDTADPNEDITLGFTAADDSDADGIADGGGADWSKVANLIRQDNNAGGGAQPIAEGIAAIEFNYVLSDNTTTTAPALNQLGLIRAVQISLLAKATSPGKLLNKEVYTTASGATWGPFNDYYRRRFASTTIKCRDME